MTSTKKTPDDLRKEAKEILAKAKLGAKKKMDEADRIERAETERLVQKILAAGRVEELEKLAASISGNNKTPTQMFEQKSEAVVQKSETEI